MEADGVVLPGPLAPDVAVLLNIIWILIGGIWIALTHLIFGILFSFQHNKSLKGMGNIITGLGFFFLGI